MKSATETVINTTLSSATSYSSGPLDVGDLYELAVDFNVTAVSGGSWHLNLSRVGADGNLYFLAEPNGSGFNSPQALSMSIGAGLPVPKAFGDQVQIDAVSPNPGVATLSTTISIKGK